MTKKQKRQNKSDWGDDFVAPDGGWGWLICIAGGLSNLSILPIWQSFGLIYRDKLLEIGLTNSQITTIINAQPAISSCTGLFNGPIYRRFSYRQTALLASIFVAFGVYLSAISNTFLGYFVSYSIIYGIGSRLSLTSTFLTINTYFNLKRRRANSFALTISGIGHILWPQIVNILLIYYDVYGTVLILSAISLNAFAFGLIYQPVNWHTKIQKSLINEFKCNKCQELLANQINNVEIKPNITNNIEELTNMNEKFNCDCKLNRKKLLNEENSEIQENLPKKNSNIDSVSSVYWYEKLIKFFDLDLLCDKSYINILIGLTLSAFSEQNFTSLTPFFLKDFQFTQNEIATAMSVLACGELIIRFLIPFLTDHIHWSSKIFYLIGISGMTIGRILIAQIPKFHILLIIFGVMGFCRALRTVFMGLVIPDHVQLNRLPAATGLQLLATGVFTLICGPLVGLIQDVTNSSFMLYFLSLISLANVILWTIELIYQSNRHPPKLHTEIE